MKKIFFALVETNTQANFISSKLCTHSGMIFFSCDFLKFTCHHFFLKKSNTPVFYINYNRIKEISMCTKW